MKKPLRIAFLSNEFVIETSDGGGLGNYLNRISQALRELGHEPEIIVQRQRRDTPAVIDFHGVRVEHVPARINPIYRWLRKLDSITLRSPWGGPSEYLRVAWSLAHTLERRHSDKPFDIVQSTNCGASGLFVGRKSNRKHIARLSSIRELTFAADGLLNGIGAHSMVWLEERAVKQADLIYAPSQFIADYYWHDKRMAIHVVRPPTFVETLPAVALPLALPARYLIHFGRISDLKGSDVVAKALPLVWQQESEFAMVWAGRERVPGTIAGYHNLWAEHATKVIWPGSVEKAALYTLLQGAEAAVLPSRVDNLPNTVIESLMLGIPVIGSNGVSIDELVEPGASGELVPIGDHEALAAAMLRVWRNEVSWIGSGFRPPAILDEMQPEIAAQKLLHLAGF